MICLLPAINLESVRADTLCLEHRKCEKNLLTNSGEIRQRLENPKYEPWIRTFWKLRENQIEQKLFSTKLSEIQGAYSLRGVPVHFPRTFLAMDFSPDIEIRILPEWKAPSAYSTLF